MSSRTLLRRSIKPVSAEPARADTSLTLSFRHRGGYATVLDARAEKEELEYPGPHGVLYTLGYDDFAELAARETGYGVSSIEVATYRGMRVAAKVFKSQRLLLLNQCLAPRQRYLSLMQAGAAEHGLCKQYRDWLSRVPANDNAPLDAQYYDTPSEILAQGVAAAAVIAGMALAARQGITHVQ